MLGWKAFVCFESATGAIQVTNARVNTQSVHTIDEPEDKDLFSDVEIHQSCPIQNQCCGEQSVGLIAAAIGN